MFNRETERLIVAALLAYNGGYPFLQVMDREFWAKNKLEEGYTKATHTIAESYVDTMLELNMETNTFAGDGIRRVVDVKMYQLYTLVNFMINPYS